MENISRCSAARAGGFPAPLTTPPGSLGQLPSKAVSNKEIQHKGQAEAGAAKGSVRRQRELQGLSGKTQSTGYFLIELSKRLGPSAAEVPDRGLRSKKELFSAAPQWGRQKPSTAPHLKHSSAEQ